LTQVAGDIIRRFIRIISHLSTNDAWQSKRTCYKPRHKTPATAPVNASTNAQQTHTNNLQTNSHQLPLHDNQLSDCHDAGTD